MIIDVHSHAWSFPAHFSDDFRQQARRAKAGEEVDLSVRFEDYAALASEPVTTIVFGGKARLSGLWVDDRYVANYVAAHPDKLFGFLALDPTQPGWEEELLLAELRRQPDRKCLQLLRLLGRRGLAELFRLRLALFAERLLQLRQPAVELGFLVRELFLDGRLAPDSPKHFIEIDDRDPPRRGVG